MEMTSSRSTVGWSANEVKGPGKDWMERLFGWWYRLTCPTRSQSDGSFAEHAC